MNYDLLYQKLSDTSSYEDEEKDIVISAVMECVKTLGGTSRNQEYPYLTSFDLINAAIATAAAGDGLHGADTLADHLQEMGIQLRNQVERARNDLPTSNNDNIVTV